MNEKVILGIDIAEQTVSVGMYSFVEERVKILTLPQIKLPGEAHCDDLAKVLFADKAEMTSFLRQVLHGASVSVGDLQALSVTIANADKKRWKVFAEAAAELSLDEKKIFLINYDEALYYYVYSRTVDVYRRKVALFRDLPSGELEFRKLYTDRQTRPAAVFERACQTFDFEGDIWDKADTFKMVSETELDDEYSAVFLMGKEFEAMVDGEMLGFLKKDSRRLFYEPQAFLTGAVFAALHKLWIRPIHGYIFMGKNCICCNVGIDILIDGAPDYFPIIYAGDIWYCAGTTFDVLADDSAKLEFLLKDFYGSPRRTETLVMKDFPKRDRGTVRLRVEASCTEKDKLLIQVFDLGFGELFPSTGKSWELLIDLKH